MTTALKSKLAIEGGKPAVSTILKPFRTIGEEELLGVRHLIEFEWPLSGYLGGKLTGGLGVEALEKEFAEAAGCRHAIACNSGTSGLLCACVAADIGPGDMVVVPAWTMSATAAVPAFLGAKIKFGDIDPDTFCLKPDLSLLSAKTKAVIVVNLFGHPAELAWWRRAADTHRFTLIEDNAQSPFSIENGKYSGTVGHIGVWSFNVHKHLHSGEGGICTTDNDRLAHKMRLFRNHGELYHGNP